MSQVVMAHDNLINQECSQELLQIMKILSCPPIHKSWKSQIMQVPLGLIRSPDPPSSCRGPRAPRRFLLHHNILFLYNYIHFLHIVIIITFVGRYIRILRQNSLSLSHLICKMCKIHFHFLVMLFSRDTKHEQFIHFHFLGWDLEMRTIRVTYCRMGML